MPRGALRETEQVFPRLSVQKQSQEENDWFAHLYPSTGCSGRSTGLPSPRLGRKEADFCGQLRGGDFHRCQVAMADVDGPSRLGPGPHPHQPGGQARASETRGQAHLSKRRKRRSQIILNLGPATLGKDETQRLTLSVPPRAVPSSPITVLIMGTICSLSLQRNLCATNQPLPHTLPTCCLFCLRSSRDRHWMGSLTQSPLYTSPPQNHQSPCHITSFDSQ